MLVARSLLRDTQLAVSGVALFVVFVLSIISRRAAISACIFHQRLGKCHGVANKTVETICWQTNYYAHYFRHNPGVVADSIPDRRRRNGIAGLAARRITWTAEYAVVVAKPSPTNPKRQANSS